MKKIFLIACILFAPVAMADQTCGENCVPQPRCVDLGYQEKGNVTCADGYIVCPFDSNYIWCRQYSCSDGGFSATNTPSVNGKMCAPVSFHGLNCFDCNQNKICKWTDYNKGDYSTLSDECEKGTYASCKIDASGILKSQSNALLKLPEHSIALEMVNYTACGQTFPFYTKWECDKGYEKVFHSTDEEDYFHYPITEEDYFHYPITHIRNKWGAYIKMVSCKPTADPEAEQISDCKGEEHPEGFTFEVDSNDPDPAHPSYGRCLPKSCPKGFDTAANLTCDDADFLPINAFSGNEPCGSCKLPDSINCVEPYVWDNNTHACGCAKEGYSINNGVCKCDSNNKWFTGRSAACADGDLDPSSTYCTIGHTKYSIFSSDDEKCFKLGDFSCTNTSVYKKGPTDCICNSDQKYYSSKIEACNKSAYGKDESKWDKTANKCVSTNSRYHINYSFVEREGCWKFDKQECETGWAGDHCKECDTENGYKQDPNTFNCILKTCEDYRYVSPSNRNVYTYTYSSITVRIGGKDVNCYEINGCKNTNYKLVNGECVLKTCEDRGYVHFESDAVPADYEPAGVTASDGTCYKAKQCKYEELTVQNATEAVCDALGGTWTQNKI